MNCNKSISTPILFLVFNRPAETKRVFDAIAAVRPKQFFVAADGPRPHVTGERERCLEVRSIIDMIDWECEVNTLFLDNNLGCGKAVSGAITWFFSHVESGIVLEDDCLPAPEFFPYCEDLLAEYRDQVDVKMIGGTNFQAPNNQKACKYYFSKIPQIWGWATWRRSWEEYDYYMSDLGSFIDSGQWRKISDDADVCYYWMRCFCSTQNGTIDTWDYQWMYTIMSRSGLTVSPGVNLIQNIGVGEDSTHTRSGFAPEITKLSDGEFDALAVPTDRCISLIYDDYTHCAVLNAKFHAIKNVVFRWRKKIRSRLKVKSMMRKVNQR
jgi:hypothetical protein